MTTQLSHLDALEAESIHIIREVAAEFEKPVLLFSGGKDSVGDAAPRREGVLAGPHPVPADARRHRPQLPRGARLPRPAGRRARRPARGGVGAGVDRRRAGWSRRPGRGRAATGCRPSPCSTRSPSNGFDAVFGGGRRDEEKARAKERVYSLPRRLRAVGPEEPAARAVEPLQRPAPQGRAHPRVPALELDRARHLAVHRATTSIELPSIYYAHRREVFRRDGMCWRSTPFVTLMDGEEPMEMTVRYRTVGDAIVHRRGRVAGGDRRRRDRRGGGVAHHRARRHPRRRQVHRSRHGRPQARGVLLMRRCCASPPRARSTTARARSSGGCCSTPSRSSRTSSSRSSARSRDTGFDYTNLALLTDGLRAEREQGITIDVAYRYFATPRRKFIIADTPGPRAVHAQHGHRRVDRRPRAGADRRAQGRARAVAPPLGDRVAARRCSTSCSASTRWTSSTTTQERFDEICDEFTRVRRQARHRPTSRSSRSRRCTATTSPSTRRTCRGTRARRCCTTSSTSTSAPTATSSTRASRCST